MTEINDTIPYVYTKYCREKNFLLNDGSTATIFLRYEDLFATLNKSGYGKFCFLISKDVWRYQYATDGRVIFIDVGKTFKIYINNSKEYFSKINYERNKLDDTPTKFVRFIDNKILIIDEKNRMRLFAFTLEGKRVYKIFEIFHLPLFSYKSVKGVFMDKKYISLFHGADNCDNIFFDALNKSKNFLKTSKHYFFNIDNRDIINMIIEYL